MYHPCVMDVSCVICGTTENLLKHHIIPLFYRAHFPMKLKSHSSHDIVLVCGVCHQKTCAEYDRFRHELALEIGVSVQPKMMITDQQRYIKKMKSSAVALVRGGGATLPEKRRHELMAHMKMHFKKENPTIGKCDALCCGSV